MSRGDDLEVRGQQAAKSGHVPVRTLYGNQTYLLAGLFACNLTRELQVQTVQPTRATTAQRTSLCVFEKVDTLRRLCCTVLRVSVGPRAF